MAQAPHLWGQKHRRGASVTDVIRGRVLIWLPWLVVALYVAARLLWLPPDDASCPGFNHDSAYIARLATNLSTGRGYVNDAHWLVFLQPDTLPMPYHNANPLYPTLIAGLVKAGGVPVLRAGWVVSVLGHGLVLAMLLVLVQRYTPSILLRTVLPLAGALFPAVFWDSWDYLPDALFSGLLLASVACSVRTRSWWLVGLAGVCFGLAWLTRSSAVVAAPALAVYLVLQHGWKTGLVRVGCWAGAAALVASPWLIYTAEVWGSPFRSDSSYYLWQEYHAARQFDGQTERFWHSMEEPASAGELLRREPGPFLAFYLRSLLDMPRALLARWSRASYVIAGLLAALLLWAIGSLLARWVRDRQIPRQLAPELTAAGVYLVLALAAFAPRAVKLEIRYLAPLSMLLALVLAWGVLDAWARLRWGKGTERLLAGAALVLGLVFWLGVVVLGDWQLARQLTTPDPARHAYLEQARLVQRYTGQDAVIVGDSPYFFNWATGAPALSIPEADDRVLRQYMRHYHARWVFLTRPELADWRQSWQEGKRPEWLEPLNDARLNGAVLFRSKDQP